MRKHRKAAEFALCMRIQRFNFVRDCQSDGIKRLFLFLRTTDEESSGKNDDKKKAAVDETPLPYKGRGWGRVVGTIQPPPNLPLHKGEGWWSQAFICHLY